MKRFLPAIAAACILGCATPPVSRESVTAIVGATVIHPEREGSAAVARDQTIVIDGHRIAAIGPSGSTSVPAGANVIDARGKWVTPGLVDGHVHFFQSGNLYTRPDAADFNAWMPYAKEVARNRARLAATFKVWLASGVTSVVDIGGSFLDFGLHETPAAGPSAPRVPAAGAPLS